MKQRCVVYLQKHFYFILITGSLVLLFLEGQDSLHNAVPFILSPLVAAIVSVTFFVHRKKAAEELLSFFLFPLFFSVVLQPLLYFFTTDSATSFVLQTLILVPISNILYAVILYRKNRIGLKSLGHLVTTVQTILFVATIVGFLIKNPFLFDGFFVNTKVSDSRTLMAIAPTLSKLSLSSVIEGATQTLSVPYLFSATAIKGWVEYRNFKSDYSA